MHNFVEGISLGTVPCVTSILAFGVVFVIILAALEFLFDIPVLSLLEDLLDSGPTLLNEVIFLACIF